ncbi:hypothetical protein FIU94_09750 [Sulfitobacter sp. THAF37]|uniref:imm11 family protein n=1 Tax=Sulfitobacter sp. THAF37 TaxID=2587855 RepID=UPI001268F26B|nr:DUF1629 domain-containing protein [Sulfitobacter sp. THAF37]QFT59107.1 hypothetical protein FIU94_09750 [Sulfitobacter sp. THAF37]
MQVPSQFILTPSSEPGIFQTEWASPEQADIGLSSEPVALRRVGETRRPRHFMYGPDSSTRLVSSAFVALLEDVDPGVHHFTPVALEMAPGEVNTGGFWLLTCGRQLSALAEESVDHLTPVLDHEGTLISIDAGTWPMLTLRRDVVAEAPFWMQMLLPAFHFCSRSFLREISLRGLEPVATIGCVKFESERFDDFS